MKSVMMMSLANIRKRKTQSILISLIFSLASLLLATAIGMLEGIQDPVKQMFENQNGSHVTMMMPNQIYKADDIVNWWESQGEIKSVNHYIYHMIEEDFKHNGKQQSMGGIMLTEYSVKSLEQDQLLIAKGEAKNSPDKDTIWVPTGYAYTWGLHIGDILEVPIDGIYKPFKIDAIVVDPQFSASMMNPVRVWVEDDFFTKEGKEEKELSSIIGIQFYDYTQYNRLWQNFEEYLQTPYLGFVFEYEFIKSAYSMVQNILGVIILSFSAIIILVSMFVLGFTVTNVIMTDYKIIGVLKAQGFTSQNIKKIYALQYLLLAFLTIPIGVIASKYVVRSIMIQMSKSLGISQLDTSIVLPGKITVFVILLGIILSSLLATAKVGKIKPAEAIRNITPLAKNLPKRKLDISTLIAFPVSFMLAIKSIFYGRRYSNFLLISAIVLAFVLSFSINTFNSV